MVAFWAFGPYDTKDQSATLKRGDCFQNIGTDKEAKTKKLDCTDPHADYKVLKMDKDSVVDTFSCSDVQGTTGSLTQSGSENGSSSASRKTTTRARNSPAPPAKSCPRSGWSHVHTILVWLKRADGRH